MHSKGYVLPTLYEGYYNAVARRCEKDLFPVLRRLGIAFLCYSPLGGGYFMTTPKAIEEGEQHRFNKNGLEGLVFRAMFMKPSYLKALDSWHDLSRNSKLSAAELAFRWISSHSALSQGLGDAIILGPETPEQLEELLTWRSKGALPASVLDQIDRIWESCENEAALDCVNGWMDDLKAGRVQPPDGYEY
jgi:aflatoxin B1 aldehyde reductase